MKKLLAVLLAVLMSVTMLVGCNNDSNDATDENGKAIKSSVATADMGVSELLTNTADQLMAESKLMTENLYGFKVDENKGAVGLDFAINGLNIPTDVITLESIKATLQGSADMDKDELMLLLSGEINGTKINVAELLWDNDKIAFASPEILNATFTLPTKNFVEKWNSSELGSLAPINLEIDDLSFSSIFSAYEMSLDVQAEMLVVTADFFEKSEKSREDAQIKLNGKNTDVTKITMVVTDKNTKAYLDKLIDVFGDMMKDGFFKGIIEQEIGTGTDYEAAVDEMIEEAKSEFDSIDFDDVTFYMYAYDGKIARIEYEGTIENVDILMYFQFNDMNKMSESIEMAIDATDGSETINVTMKSTGNLTSTTDSVLKYNLDMVGTQNGDEVFNMVVGAVFDYGKNEYELYVDASAEGEDIYVSAEGECYRSSKEFKLTFDNITGNIDGESFSLTEILNDNLGSNVSMDIAVMVYPAKSLSMTKTKKTYDITQMKQSDILGFEAELMTNVQDLASKLGISLY